MDPRKIRALHLVPMILVLSSCVAYEPRPLHPETIVAEVDEARQQERLEHDESLTFARTVLLMQNHSPDLKQAVAAFETATAKADVATPLANPALTTGPTFAFGNDVGGGALGGIAGLGLSLPLGGRLSAMDDLNQVKAEVARIETIARFRELYVDLRRRWARMIAAKAMLQTAEELATSVGQSITTARRLVEAGSAAAIDVALLELEGGRSEAVVFQARTKLAMARADISELVGVGASVFLNVGNGSTPELPLELPDKVALQAALQEGHPNLLRLRAAYEQAESALRLEIARQYPDLRIGPMITDESGEQKMVLGLTLGIELPIFDRNQQAIAWATSRREECRVRYEAEANRALGQLERAMLKLKLTAQYHRVLIEKVLPSADRSIQIVRASLRAGSGDVQRLLLAERSHRQVLIDVKKAALAECEAWMDVETATGLRILDLGDTPFEREMKQ